MNTDRWYYRVFQSAPDLIRELLPGSAAGANTLGHDPAAPGDQLYRFEALEIKDSATAWMVFCGRAKVRAAPKPAVRSSR